jgi:hypothetical protein
MFMTECSLILQLSCDRLGVQIRLYDKHNRSIYFKAHPKEIKMNKGKYKVPDGIDKDVTG